MGEKTEIGKCQLLNQGGGYGRKNCKYSMLATSLKSDRCLRQRMSTGKYFGCIKLAMQEKKCSRQFLLLGIQKKLPKSASQAMYINFAGS